MFIETSAKTDFQIQLAFAKMTEKLISINEAKGKPPKETTININKKNSVNNTGGIYNCCK